MTTGNLRAVSLVAITAALGLTAMSGCTSAPPAAAVGSGPAEIVVPLFTAGDALERDWRKLRVWKEAEFSLTALDGEIAIRAVAEGASAGLARRVEIDPAVCPILEWSWRVEAGLTAADLSSRQGEDVAAAIFLAFGDPGLLASPREVPTLRYVWATETDPVESVVDSPYYPGVIRSVVVRSGPEAHGTWVSERRDLVADYRRVFGGLPEDPIELFVLFTDSDHGGERVEVLYRWARVLCTHEPEAPSIF